MARRELKSPFPQRYLEPGDWVMVAQQRDTENPLRMNGHVGRIEDYSAYDGHYNISGVPFRLHHSELYEFDWEWSGT